MDILYLLLSALPSAAVNSDGWFVERVAPILRQRCVPCHNPVKIRGGLDLSSRAHLLQGGNEGPALLPGNADKSLLMRMIGGPEPKMPKQGARLTQEEIAAIRRWIEDGAVWPDSVTLVESPKKSLVGPDWWALRPLVRPDLPRVKQKSWVRTPMDAFILATLEEKGLRPSPPADKWTLIRRVFFDLHGLPPTPEQVEAFLKDDSPEAYERLIDDVLASPRYGERWGRHWLDVVHYGDTHGYDKDKRRDSAWPYRDYVIGSLNSDKPYERFIKEQIAGDVLYADDPAGVVATGLIAAGPWDFVGHVELREGTVEKAKTRLLDRDDMLATTMLTFNSMTVHCARCHDHKFDPIPQSDYYQLQAVFAGIERGNRLYGDKTLLDQHAALDNKLKELQTQLQRLSRERKKTGDADIEARVQRDLDEANRQVQATREQLRSLKTGQVYAVVRREPRPIHRLLRGDVEQPGALVQPGALSCVPDVQFRLADPHDEGSRRAALANWIADRKNVLTWRSIVNRVWHYHFGKGIVDTPSDFGWNSSRPTHPELLDWLAVEFRDGGQSLKRLHRLILLSNTYRQASRDDPIAARIDSDNRYLWRMNRQRLDAELIRDAVLAVSGQLNLKMGGQGYELFRFKDDHSPVYDHTAIEKINDPQTFRRTVYRFVVRSVPNPFLECLDVADPNLNVPVRNTTLTALQALALLNDPFVLKQAEYFAQRLQAQSSTLEGQIETAFQLALSRPPTANERESLTVYARKHGLENMCRLLLNTNEFAFID